MEEQLEKLLKALDETYAQLRVLFADQRCIDKRDEQVVSLSRRFTQLAELTFEVKELSDRLESLL